jgi:anti-sigma factor RsiW
MNCDEAVRTLHEELDGTLPADARAALDTHLAHCPACAALAADLRALTRTARSLPLDLAPARDLWPEIAARLDDGSASQPRASAAPIPFAGRAGATPSHGALRRHWPLATAAGLGGALLASFLTWTLLGGGSTATAPAGSPTTTTADAAPLGADPASVADGSIDRIGLSALAAGASSLDRGAVDRVSLDRAYGVATSNLERLYARHAEDLAPETRAAIDKSLAAIDTALEEIRRALAADPASGPLLRELDRLQRHRLDLLERAAELGTRT